MPIYLASNDEIDLNNLNIFHLDENKAVENYKEETINLYKLNYKEAMPIIYYSNIIFYDNSNKTLPLGMNLSDEVLVNLKNCSLKEISKETFKINYLLNEYTNKIVTVNVIEYDTKIN